MTADPALADLADDLVAANRILARRGILDGFGHVSARDPRDPARFLLARSIAPAQVTREDLMVFDHDGEPVGGDARRPYLERFIHAAIYRRRPDVHAIVHSHSPSVIPFASSSVRLRPIYHMAGFLSGGAPVFDNLRKCRPRDRRGARRLRHGVLARERRGRGRTVAVPEIGMVWL